MAPYNVVKVGYRGIEESHAVVNSIGIWNASVVRCVYGTMKSAHILILSAVY